MAQQRLVSLANESSARSGSSSISSARTVRRLAAILAADVVGYSRLMGEDEEGTLAALKAVRRDLVDLTIRDYRGRIVKTTGDGLLVEFASVVDAVRCAIAIQSKMAERNAGVPADCRMEFRMGINIGDIIIDNNDIFGDGVNVAARLEPLAEPGGICVSRVVRDQVRDKLNLALDDMGNRRVKNIARPVRVYRILVAQSPATQAAGKVTRSGKSVVSTHFFRHLHRFISLRFLAIIICGAVTASVIPKSWEISFWPRPEGKVKPATDVPGPRVEAGSPTGLPTVIGEPVFFEKGKVTLSEAGHATIDRQAAFLYENPKITVTIAGYASEDEGAREGPLVLAQLRANQVRNALKERGVADSRIHVAHGKPKPAMSGESEATQAMNRRVVVLQN